MYEVGEPMKCVTEMEVLMGVYNTAMEEPLECVVFHSVNIAGYRKENLRLCGWPRW